MRVVRPIIVGSLISTLFVGAVAPSAGADPDTDAGVAWLATQQQANGGFEVAGFDGFETPDAILAIAANAQTTTTWSTEEAFNAVDAVDFQSSGVTALDWVDAWVDGELTSPPLVGQEAKLIFYVALPLGFDPTDFDPGNDDVPGAGVDLTAGLDENAPAVFNSFLFARLAESALGENVHQADLQVICEAQKATGGGWSFDGDPAGANSADMDTTGFAVMALVAAGVPPTDAVLDVAETFVVNGQATTGDDIGSWLSFGSPDPNATALGMLALTALASSGGDISAAVQWLQEDQVVAPGPDQGRFLSPNDAFPPVNTFATSQAVQALLLDQDPSDDWLPLPGPTVPDRRCLPESAYTDVAPTAWYDDGARFVDDADIVGGVNGALRPAGNVNRAQAAAWLNEVFGGVGGPPNSFTDVPDGAWYEDGVDFVSAAPNGPIASGFGNQFRPGRLLNRAQTVSWLYAAAGSPDVSALPAHGFSDVGASAWFGDAATWAKANGIVLGFGNGTFRGSRNVNRSQLAQWLFNLVATPEAWSDGAVLPPTILFDAPT